MSGTIYGYIRVSTKEQKYAFFLGVLLSLMLCVSLAAPAYAADFADLQATIDDTWDAPDTSDTSGAQETSSAQSTPSTQETPSAQDTPSAQNTPSAQATPATPDTTPQPPKNGDLITDGSEHNICLMSERPPFLRFQM